MSGLEEEMRQLREEYEAYEAAVEHLRRRDAALEPETATEAESEPAVEEEPREERVSDVILRMVRLGGEVAAKDVTSELNALGRNPNTGYATLTKLVDSGKLVKAERPGYRGAVYRQPKGSDGAAD